MTTLTEFLLARIAEDEADPWRGAELIGTDRVVGSAEQDALRRDQDEWEARVLAECEAKRRIVDLHGGGHECWDGSGLSGWYGEPGMDDCPTLTLLSAPYADHPDYDQSWRR